MLIWVDEWQMGCCGDPVVVGQRVRWTVLRSHDGPVHASATGLATVLGSELAAQVEGREDHHGGDEDPAAHVSVVTGQVQRVRRVWCRYGRVRPDVPDFQLVQGSTVLEEVRSARTSYARDGDLRCTGYLVDLDLGTPGRPIP